MDFIKDITKGALVPKKPLAKLMYYLRNVCLCIDLRDVPDIGRLTDFHHYHLLTKEEVDQVVCICFTLSPEHLIGRCFLEEKSICGSGDNIFCSLEEFRSFQSQQIPECVWIGGVRRNITTVMKYRTHWMEEYFHDPIKEYEDVLENAKMNDSLSKSPVSRKSETTYGTFHLISPVS